MIQPGSKVIIPSWEPWASYSGGASHDDWKYGDRHAIVISVDRRLRANVAFDSWAVAEKRTTAAERGYLFDMSELVEVSNE